MVLRRQFVRPSIPPAVGAPGDGAPNSAPLPVSSPPLTPTKPVFTRPKFNPKDWYWLVGSADSPAPTQVYSSKIGDYVPLNDATYVAWLAQGNRPLKVDSEDILGNVMVSFKLRPVAAGVLDAFQETQAQGVADGLQFKILFNHENRIRTLESKAPLTQAQFKAMIKAQM